MKYLFLGASNTDCDHCFTPDNLGKGYVKFFALRQAFAGDTVINGGTNGFTYPRILQKYLAFYREERFDDVFLLGGINEAGMLADNGLSSRQSLLLLDRSESSLRQLIFCLYAQGTGRVFLLEPFLFPRSFGRESWIPAYESVRRRLLCCAEDFKTLPFHFVPLQDPLTRLADSVGAEHITKDGIHLTSQGHRFVADRLCRVLPEI